MRPGVAISARPGCLPLAGGCLLPDGSPRVLFRRSGGALIRTGRISRAEFRLVYFLLEFDPNGLDTFLNGDNPEPWFAHLRNYADSPAALQVSKLNFRRIILIGLEPKRPGEVLTSDACPS